MPCWLVNCYWHFGGSKLLRNIRETLIYTLHTWLVMLTPKSYHHRMRKCKHTCNGLNLAGENATYRSQHSSNLCNVSPLPSEPQVLCSLALQIRKFFMYTVCDRFTHTCGTGTWSHCSPYLVLTHTCDTGIWCTTVGVIISINFSHFSRYWVLTHHCDSGTWCIAVAEIISMK
jgi:hypothetical protein